MKKSRKRVIVLGGLAGLGAVGVAAWFANRPRLERPATYSFGGPDKKNGVSRDPSLLVPAFADKLELLVRALRKRGYSPMLNEGYRSHERARKLAGEGVGIPDSMHCYGVGADFKDAKTEWADREFFIALGEEARALGLTWGGDWDGDGETEPGESDMGHVQGVPATAAAQNAIRRAQSLAEADDIVRRYVA